MNNSRKRRSAIPLNWSLAAFLGMLAFLAPAEAQPLTKIESVGFTVSDMDMALDFYTRVLPFEKVSEVETWGSEIEHLSGVFGARVRVVRLRLGSETLELTEFMTPQGRPIPVDSRSNDQWFQHIAIIVSDMDKAYEMLRVNKVRHSSTAPQTLPTYIAAAAGIKAFYFKDFDNHVLEILKFPDGKGAQKWHDLEKTGKLFLGIDHTAIVVSDTEASVTFYRNRLGLSVAGSSDNFGTEQEHLNNVFGAKLHITGLKTKDDGIAVEFLEYRAPTDGRPYPKYSRSNDLWHWQTSFAASGIEQFLAGYRAKYISSGLVLFDKRQLGFSKAALIRDPDGHAVRITER